MQRKRANNHDRSMWIEVENLCRNAIELTQNVQLSIREYPGLHLNGGYISWELLHELTTHGAVSIGDLLKPNSFSREWVRRLVCGLVDGGLAEFIPNPYRRKSTLVRTTELGNKRYKEICIELEHFAHDLTLNTRQVADAVKVIDQINNALIKTIEKRRNLQTSNAVVESNHHHQSKH